MHARLVGYSFIALFAYLDNFHHFAEKVPIISHSIWSDKKTYAVTDRSGYTNEKWWSTRDEIFQLN